MSVAAKNMSTAMVNKAKIYYRLMITSFCLRLFWMVAMEPRGMKKVIANHPGTFVASTIKPIVYSTTAILAVILIAALFKKRWSYMAGLIFGVILLGMILYMPIAGFSPGFGPYIVIPICAMMIIFSYLTMNKTK